MKQKCMKLGSIALVVCMILTMLPTISYAAEININETNFPDANFRKCLMETDLGKDGILTEEEIHYFTDMDLKNKGISSLKGIGIFTNLKNLLCDGNNLTELPELPTTLVTLHCSNNSLTELPELPTTLTGLNCSNNSLTKLPGLPSDMFFINCDDNDLSALPVLPSSLSALYCNNNNLTEIPELPSSLMALTCNDNSLTALPALPSSLQALTCKDNRLTALTLNNNANYTFINVSSNLMKDESDVTGKSITWEGTNFIFSPQKDTTPPVLSKGSSFRMTETGGSITFTTDEAGTVYYKMVNCGATAPAKVDIVSGGTAFSIGSATQLTHQLTLTAEAKDVYVVIKDAEGNISDPLKIEIAAYVVVDLTSPILSNGDSDRTSDTEATIYFDTDEAGMAFYTVVDKDATAPDKAAIASSGTSLGAVSGANIEKEVTLSAGEKDIYVVVKDAANNISDPLKIQVAAYVSPVQTVANQLTALNFSTAVNGNTVTVTGTVTGVTAGKSITIPSGVTVKWGAVMTGTVYSDPMLTVVNEGRLEIISGAKLENSGSVGTTLDCYKDGSLLVSGGEISFSGNRGCAISVREGGNCVITGGTVSTVNDYSYQLRLDGVLAVIANNALISRINTDDVFGPSAVVRVADGTSSATIGSAEGLSVTPYNLGAGDSLTTQWLVRSGISGINVLKNKNSKDWFAPYTGVSLHTPTPVDNGGGSSSGGNTGGGSSGGGGSTSTTKPEANVTGGDSSIKTEIKTDTKAGSASAELTSLQVAKGKDIAVTIPKITGVSNYSLGIPGLSLSSTGGSGSVTLNTDVGNIMLPSNMLASTNAVSGKQAQIHIGVVKLSDLPKDAQDKVGNHPIVSLELSIDGKTTAWNNPNAPVTVSIPYTPTAEELKNPKQITVWYIDGSGKLIEMKDAKYDSVTKKVVFTTTHFSNYAVGYQTSVSSGTFSDVLSDAWYYEAVNFIAEKGITTGTEVGKFSPEATLKRGQFIVMLMKAYGIQEDKNATANFTDAGNTYYTGYLAAAKAKGISSGLGDNKFGPEQAITRQEMFTLLYNAQKVIGQIPKGNSGKTVSDFSDALQIANWARESITTFIGTGTISGNAGKIQPLSTTTRAEMAQVLYNLLKN